MERYSRCNCRMYFRGLGRQSIDPFGQQIRQTPPVQIKRIFFRDEAKPQIVERKRAQQVGPGLIELSTGAVAEQVVVEKLVVAMVFDQRVVAIAFGMVVRAVEGRGNRVSIRRRRLAMRHLRQNAGEFQHASLPRGKVGGVGASQKPRDEFALIRLLELRKLASHDAVVAVPSVQFGGDQQLRRARAGRDRKLESAPVRPPRSRNRSRQPLRRVGACQTATRSPLAAAIWRAAAAALREDDR